MDAGRALLAGVACFYLGPLLNILWLSVTDPEPGLGNYEKLVTSDTLARIMWTTFRICLITTAFSVTIGYSIAYAMVHAHQKNQHVMLTFLLVSFWISVLVRTFAWLMLLGRNGVVNNSFETIGLIIRANRVHAQRIGRADRHGALHGALCGAAAVGQHADAGPAGHGRLAQSGRQRRDKHFGASTCR